MGEIRKTRVGRSGHSYPRPMHAGFLTRCLRVAYAFTLAMISTHALLVQTPAIKFGRTSLRPLLPSRTSGSFIRTIASCSSANSNAGKIAGGHSQTMRADSNTDAHAARTASSVTTDTNAHSTPGHQAMTTSRTPSAYPERQGLHDIKEKRRTKTLVFTSFRSPALVLGLLLVLALCLGAPAAGTTLVWLYNEYDKAALAFPLITKSATSAVAYLLGDTIAQGRNREQPIDRLRLARVTFAGGFSHGPQLHYWTMLLEQSGLPLLAKVALDQTIFALYINAAFAVLTELLTGRSLCDALNKAKVAAVPCLIAGWRFWPLAHLITYTIIPLHLRVLWVDILEVAWVAILSTCVARSKAPSKAPPLPSAQSRHDGAHSLSTAGART